jgi:plasmid stabilization system protein ParE
VLIGFAHPASGRSGRVPGTRELVISGTPYVVPYSVHGETVEILRVFTVRENGRGNFEVRTRLTGFRGLRIRGG